MKRRLMILCLMLSLIFGLMGQVLAAQAQFVTPILVVNTSFLNVRSADGPQYSTIATVVGGTELPVLGSNSSLSWYLVSTAFGPGWVDVSFTLPRGDFRNVPVVKPDDSPVFELPTPLTIGLPGSANVINVVPVTNVPTGQRASLNVISVNLRTQPGDSAPVIGIVFKDTLPDYAVAGYGGDSRGVPWVAIVVPGMGTGWIEQPKTTIFQATAATANGATASAAPAPVLEGAHVIVNTSYQNVRRGAGPQFETIAVVPGGTRLEVVAVTGGTSVAWYLVNGTFGQGWISSEYVLFRGTFSNVPRIFSPY